LREKIFPNNSWIAFPTKNFKCPTNKNDFLELEVFVNKALLESFYISGIPAPLELT